MKQKNKKNAGFSLIEVLFAMVFLTVIIFGVLKLQTSNLVLANTQKNELKAHFYATQALEIAQSMGPEVFKDCTTCSLLADAQNNYTLKLNQSESLDDLFTRSLEKKEALNGAFLLTSKVSWTDNTGEHEAKAKRVIF